MASQAALSQLDEAMRITKRLESRLATDQLVVLCQSMLTNVWKLRGKAGRRFVLKDSSLLFAAEHKDPLRVGLIIDLHYADKPAAGTRHYRESLSKLAEAAAQFEKDKESFVAELGDLIDAVDSVETDQRYRKTINREFSATSKDRHYVVGNHCVDTLTKAEFLDSVEQK